VLGEREKVHTFQKIIKGRYKHQTTEGPLGEITCPQRVVKKDCLRVLSVLLNL
jgi:hypothetical protein